jgi:hypothetical protein
VSLCFSCPRSGVWIWHQTVVDESLYTCSRGNLYPHTQISGYLCTWHGITDVCHQCDEINVVRPPRPPKIRAERWYAAELYPVSACRQICFPSRFFYQWRKLYFGYPRRAAVYFSRSRSFIIAAGYFSERYGRTDATYYESIFRCVRSLQPKTRNDNLTEQALRDLLLGGFTYARGLQL